MEFKQNVTEAKTLGEIQGNKVSIDAANMDFIITILSTNLYSKPIESFVRETVSNAWDSHVEAGVKKPVVLEIGTDSEGVDYCKVQDFGVGISPDRFNNIYRNIGSSTKRSNNDQIGGFGIGRFSALAYSEMVNITSIYDGIEYKYLMYKDGNSISIDLLHEMETENPNGVSVTLSIKNGDTINFMKAVRSQLLYFENLYVDTSRYVGYSSEVKLIGDGVNSLTIKKYNNFAVNSFQGSNNNISLILGKVTYPLRMSSLKKVYPNSLANYGISLIFNIGDLQVTPNREEVLYNDKNTAKIEEVLDKAIDEIEDMLTSMKTKDYDNITDFLNAIRERTKIVLLTHPTQGEVAITTAAQNSQATLNGKSYTHKDFIGMHDRMVVFYGFKYSHEVLGGKIVKSSNHYMDGKLNIGDVKRNFSNHFLCAHSILGNVAKSYIREKFPEHAKLVTPIRNMKRVMKAYIKDLKEGTLVGMARYKYDRDIFKVLAKYFLDNISQMKVFSDAHVPKAYIDAKVAESKAKRLLVVKNAVDWKQNMNLYPLRASERGSYGSVVIDSELHSLEELKKKYPNTVLYAEKDESPDFRRLYFLVSQTCKDVTFLEVAPTKMKLLKNLPNFVNFKDFMKNPKYRLLRDIATAYEIRKNYPNLVTLAKLENLDTISEKLAVTVKELSEFQEKHLKIYRPTDKGETALLEEIYNICKEKNYFNFNMLGLMRGNSKLLKNSMFLINFRDTGNYAASRIPTQQINPLVDYIVSRKLFIPNRETLKNFRIEQQKQITNEGN